MIPRVHDEYVLMADSVNTLGLYLVRHFKKILIGANAAFTRSTPVSARLPT